MDREILFRGKRLDDGEWVEGCYVKTKTGQAYILPDLAYISFEYQTIAIGGFVEVAPSTVGRYTGLTDKNGVKIFEGDIVKQTNFYDHLKIQGPVVYGKAAQYIVRHTYTEQENPYKKGKTKAFAVSPRCEVISSVHDNPELIGGEGDD